MNVKTISAKKTYTRPRKEIPGVNIIFKRIQAASMEQNVNAAVAYSKEAASVIGRWLLFGHLTPFEAEAARCYASIMARFDRFFTEGSRTARSQSFERSHGEDQELERLESLDAVLGGAKADYEKSARKARRRYDRLQKVLAPYSDPLTGRNLMKDALDQMCCHDLEPPSAWRKNIAAALRNIGKEFNVDVKPKRRGGRPTRNGRGYRLRKGGKAA